MPYVKDGFQFWEPSPDPYAIPGEMIIIDPAKIKDIIRYSANNNIRNIWIRFNEYPVKNLDFLSDMPWIEGVMISMPGLDLTPLHQLRGLKGFAMHELNSKVDFSHFPKLEFLSVKYDRKKALNIGSCKKLRALFLESYPHSDLSEFNSLSELELLILSMAKFNSLKGIDGMVSLKDLRLENTSQLTTMDGLSEKNRKLEELCVYNAKKLSDYSAFAYCKYLKSLRLIKTGDIPSLSVLEGCKNLEILMINSKVLDGDMSLMKRLAEKGAQVQFSNSPHYNVKMKDIKAILDKK